MLTTKRIFIYSGIAAAIILFGIWLLAPKKGPYDVITPPDVSAPTSFFECVGRGNVVLESYPRKCRTPNGEVFVEEIGNEIDKLDAIRIDSPRPNAFVSSPIRIAGQARGTWFFEGSFPLFLADGNGNIVAEGFATAQEDGSTRSVNSGQASSPQGWMTEGFVAYSSLLEFVVPEDSDFGILTLQKDNPSGLAKNADALEVPVRFR